MMEPLHIVVEGRRDAVVLRRLLPDAFAHARYFAAGGRSSLATVARNLLVHEIGHVMVVADADTHDPQRAQEDRAALLLALHHMAPAPRADVFLFVPELEVVFFECPSVLDTLRASASADAVLLNQGAVLPRKGINALLRSNDFETWVGSIPNNLWQAMRTGPQAAALVRQISALEPPQGA